MSPPKLTGNTPIASTVHPVHIVLCKAFGNKFNLALFNAFNSGLCKRLHFYKPLLWYHRLNIWVTTVTGSDLVCKRLDFLYISACFKICNNSLTCFKSCHTCIFSAVSYNRLILSSLSACNDFVGYCLFLCTGKMSVVSKGTNYGKIVTKTNFKVVRVVGRSDFYYACSLCHICVLVAYDRNFNIQKRQDNVTTVKMSISRIVGIYCNGSITEHRFGSCCCKLQLLARFLNSIEQVPEIRILRFIFNLGVGNGGIAMRTPVYHTVSSVNQSVIVKLAENGANGIWATLVKSKAFSFPIAGGAHFFELFYNSAAILLLPSPSTLKEFFSAYLLLCYTLFTHCLNNLCFGRNWSVVGSGEPKSVVAVHSVETNENILQGIIKSVSHMKLTCDIRGRNNYCVGRLIAFFISVKIAVIHPKFINLILKRGGVVLFFKFLWHKIIS